MVGNQIPLAVLKIGDDNLKNCSTLCNNVEATMFSAEKKEGECMTLSGFSFSKIFPVVPC